MRINILPSRTIMIVILFTGNSLQPSFMKGKTFPQAVNE